MALRPTTAPIALAALLALACNGKAESAGQGADTKAGAGDADGATAGDETGPAPDAEDTTSAEAFHRVVFADRTSMGYLLLLPGAAKPEVPTREAIKSSVESAFAGKAGGAEVDLALDLIDMEPKDTQRSAAETSDLDKGVRVARAKFDLIGFHIDVLEVTDDLIPAEALTDPVFTRDVAEADRAGLAGRKWALLLRADYRNLNGVRGLRLLQAIVRVVARDRGAVIHDPDTLETMSLDRFTERRLRSELGNVADQVAVIPFPDEEVPGKVRLSTRGMRRFGAPDLELDGLDPDPETLQRATYLVHALALVMVREGEVHESGFAIEAPDLLTVYEADLQRAYSGRQALPPRCEGCEGFVKLHLVKRLAKTTDAHEHAVVRIVAPRVESDEPDYDHAAWVQRSLSRLLGD